MLLSKDGIPEDAKYFQITADNGVVLHVLRTEPSSISLYSINDNVVRSETNGINGGFFWDNQLLSIAVMDGIPVNGSPKEYGSGWFNIKYDRGTIVYDRVTGMVDVQRAASVDDLHMSDATKFWAQGGVSMNLKDESKWYNLAVKEERLPFPDDERLRSAMAYDNLGEIYLVVTSSKCTAGQFRTAIKRNVAVGNLNEAIFLDGDGSSQLLAGNVKLEGDARKVLQMIGVTGERR
ncbi:phosphodiester glycosidase family protein [Paenibacillus crassostreae]|uniref:phosphodiester glycosidase family protein n=1 Tax=Paenibacillus crassostreae TaxID=1763538 RepID=UPI0012FD2BBE|nr:phosphodiester glycosidase family protein [Paenibacillus crassostreae]